jgi:hypothetical protein
MLAKAIQKILEKQVVDNYYSNEEVKKKVKQLLSSMEMEGMDEDLMDDIDYAFDYYVKAMGDLLYYAEKLEDQIKKVK